MYFEKVPTIPTAEEILDRSYRRAAAKKREKKNKKKANEEFVRAIYRSVHDKLDATVKTFPTFDNLPVFYQEMAEILFGINKLKKSLGALTWASNQARVLGSEYAQEMRKSEDVVALRKQATARISSVVYQIDKDLHFLNEARNVLRKLPDIRDEFTIVVAGYPNVGKSSFIRLVSSAEPEVAGYAFTTKEVYVGHYYIGRERIQIVDTPGILDRPAQERNYIEHQALTAITNVADVILFLLDASETCGYSLDNQKALLDEISRVVGDDVPVEVVVNKSDLCSLEGYLNMSTETEEGVSEAFAAALRYRPERKWEEPLESSPTSQ